MIIKSFELFKFQIPLIKPLKISSKSISHRDGLVLKLYDENNNTGFGEISPLPGFHKETFAQVIDQTIELIPTILNIEISENFDILNKNLDVLFKEFDLYPSVQFGLETALISFFAENKNISILEFLNSSSNKSIKINALLSGSHNQIIEKVKKYLLEGYRVFKLKVGRNKIEGDIEIVNQISNLINGKAKLRLDANLSWTLKKALQFIKNVDSTNLEYIEEPLTKIEELKELLNKTEIPIALDENVLSIYNMPNKHLSHIKAIIIKPTVIGGIEKSLKLIQFAEENNIAPVISDTFQSGIGLSTLFAIASTIKNRIAMGFDTYSWLENDILNAKLQFSKNIFSLKNMPNVKKNLNYSNLTQIF